MHRRGHTLCERCHSGSRPGCAPDRLSGPACHARSLSLPFPVRPHLAFRAACLLSIQCKMYILAAKIVAWRREQRFPVRNSHAAGRLRNARRLEALRGLESGGRSDAHSTHAGNLGPSAEPHESMHCNLRCILSGAIALWRGCCHLPYAISCFTAGFRDVENCGVCQQSTAASSGNHRNVFQHFRAD